MSIDTYPPQNVSAQTPTLGYAQVTAPQTGISTSRVDLTNLSVTVTVPAGRRIRITGQVLYNKITNPGWVMLGINEGATSLGEAYVEPATGDFNTATAIAVVSPSAGTHTYKLMGLAETATVNVDANPTYPAFILVEDITGSQLPVLPQSVPVGALAYAQATTTQGGITSGSNLTGLSVNVSVLAGRQLRITGHVGQFTRTAGTVTYVGIAIEEGTNWLGQTTVSVNNTYGAADVTTVISPSAGSHTYHLSAFTDGTVQMDASAAGNPAYILIEDITPTPAPGQGAPGSTLGYAEQTTAADLVVTTNPTDLTGLSVTVTVPASRRLRITGKTHMSSNLAAGDRGVLTIREGAAALNSSYLSFGINDVGEDFFVSHIITPSAGSHTYKLTAGRSAGDGVVTAYFDPDLVSYILVEDITGAVWPVGSTVTAGMVASEEWTAYTPTNTNITLGNGVQIARYQRIGRTINVYYRLTRGSTTSFTGGIGIGLPVALSASAGACGAGHFLDVGTQNFLFNVYANPSGTVATPLATAGGGFDATTPITWVTNDVIEFSMTYEAAS